MSDETKREADALECDLLLLERLRSSLEGWAQAVTELTREKYAAEAEVDRLRAIVDLTTRLDAEEPRGLPSWSELSNLQDENESLRGWQRRAVEILGANRGRVAARDLADVNTLLDEANP